MTLRVIDCETTGRDPDADAILEIASVDILKVAEDKFGIVNELAALVNPGREIPPEASAVHHILKEDVEGALSIEHVIHAFKGADAYVAHRCDFDKAFLAKHLGDAKWVCTYKVALRVWPDAPGHSNQTLRYWRGLYHPFGRDRTTLTTHRALSDAIVTAALFVELLKVAKWSDMLKWSAEPALHTKFNFGKHKGKRYDEAPDDYLEWIIDKSELDADTKFSAEYWLTMKQPAVQEVMKGFDATVTDVRSVEKETAA